MKEEDSPLVSIIIPMFNEEENIKRNIESILEGSYENIEIIVVDDNSDDEGTKILNRYLEIDERVHLIKNEKNKGASYSRNIALDKAKGKYVMFLDADDWAEKDLVSVLVKNALEDNLDIVQINYIKEEDNLSKPNKHFKVKDEIYKGREDVLENIYALISDNKSSESYFSHIRSVSGKIYKRSIIEKGEKIRFNEDLIISENIFFNLEYFLRCKKIKYVQKYLIHFTKDKFGISSSYIKNIEKDSKESIKYMRKIIKEIKTNFKLNKSEKELLDKYFAYFIYERIYLVYKHNINMDEELEEKDKKRQLIEHIKKNNLIRYIKMLDKNKLNEKEQKFLKYIKNAIFLKKFRII